ncbi:MAG: hypothetical protein IT319_18980 [Anaerolineae bacterium]|nr:hypothetical protein [Anaerolineae bacterium]
MSRSLPARQTKAQPALLRQVTHTPRAIATAIPTVVNETTGVTESVTETPVPSPDIWVFGTSAGGKDLFAQRFGAGERVLLLVGGIHGGWEANTVELMHLLIDHFTAQPQDIPPNISVIVVADANPDGSAYPGIARGRFNGSGVDLNRNWGCDWSPDAFWRQQRISAGLTPFSEPESRALRDLMLSERPAAALFYHSAASGVYAGECDGNHGSAELSAVLGAATSYSYGSTFSAYPVTGTAVDWADGQGIPAADVELASHADSEFERNLRGIRAVLAWISEDG